MSAESAIRMAPVEYVCPKCKRRFPRYGADDDGHIAASVEHAVMRGSLVAQRHIKACKEQPDA